MDKGSKIVAGIIIAVVFAGTVSLIYFSQDTGNVLNSDGGSSNDNLNSVENDMQTQVEDFSELEITTVQEGTGEGAVVGNTVSVNYEGKLIDGTKFDSSYDRGTPFEFTLGENMVIAGWEEGVLGMKVGEIRELKIPSSMGYGQSGAGSIPANAGLVFTVELLEIK